MSSWTNITPPSSQQKITYINTPFIRPLFKLSWHYYIYCNITGYQLFWPVSLYPLLIGLQLQICLTKLFSWCRNDKLIYIIYMHVHLFWSFWMSFHIWIPQHCLLFMVSFYHSQIFIYAQHLSMVLNFHAFYKYLEKYKVCAACIFKMCIIYFVYLVMFNI